MSGHHSKLLAPEVMVACRDFPMGNRQVHVSKDSFGLGDLKRPLATFIETKHRFNLIQSERLNRKFPHFFLCSTFHFFFLCQDDAIVFSCNFLYGVNFVQINCSVFVSLLS